MDYYEALQKYDKEHPEGRPHSVPVTSKILLLIGRMTMPHGDENSWEGLINACWKNPMVKFHLVNMIEDFHMENYEECKLESTGMDYDFSDEWKFITPLQTKILARFIVCCGRLLKNNSTDL